MTFDRDPLFLSHFWKELFHLQDTKLKFSTIYHSQTDSETEVIYWSLELYLKCFASDNPRTWYQYLHLIQFWYNSSYHSAIKIVLFQALYGRPLSMIPNYRAQPWYNITGMYLNAPPIKGHTMENSATYGVDNKSIPTPPQLHRRRLGTSLMTCISSNPSHPRLISSSQEDSTTFTPSNTAYELVLSPSSRIHPVFHISLQNPIMAKHHHQRSTTLKNKPLHLPPTHFPHSSQVLN